MQLLCLQISCCSVIILKYLGGGRVMRENYLIIDELYSRLVGTSWLLVRARLIARAKILTLTGRKREMCALFTQAIRQSMCNRVG